MNTGWQKALHKLYLPLSVLAGALLLAYLLIAHTLGQYNNARQAAQAQQAQLQQARERLSRSGEEKATIERYLPTYLQLQQQGLIGAEQRLSWVDGLRAVNQQLRLYGVDYQINAQQAYNGSDLGSTAGFAVYQSEMTLRFSLLHENDLLRFFDQLQAMHIGLYQIKQCTLQRSTASYTSFGSRPNLLADCKLQWLTLQPPGGA